MAWLSHEAEVCARSGQSTLTSSRSRLQRRAEQSVLATRDDAPNSTQLRRRAQLPRKIEIAEPSRPSTGKYALGSVAPVSPRDASPLPRSLCSCVGKLSQEHLPLLQLLRAPNGRLRHPNLCAHAKREALRARLYRPDRCRNRMDTSCGNRLPFPRMSPCARRNAPSYGP
jgi:hypothetical protein